MHYRFSQFATWVVGGLRVENETIGLSAFRQDTCVVQDVTKLAVFVIYGDIVWQGGRDETLVVCVLHEAEKLRCVFVIEKLAGFEFDERLRQAPGAEQVVAGVIITTDILGVALQLRFAEIVCQEVPGFVVALLDHLLQLKVGWVGAELAIKVGYAAFDSVIVGESGQDFRGAGSGKGSCLTVTTYRSCLRVSNTDADSDVRVTG